MNSWILITRTGRPSRIFTVTSPNLREFLSILSNCTSDLCNSMIEIVESLAMMGQNSVYGYQVHVIC